MIVYNVQRRWFTKKDDAERYRVAQGIRRGGPKNIIRVEVKSRDDLAALLNALCEPGSDPVAEANLTASDPAALIDKAFVAPSTDVPDCVPRFLLSDEQKRERDRAREATR